MAFELRVEFVVDDYVLTELHSHAFGGVTTGVIPWKQRLAAHSLTWVGAFDRNALVGFVHACWDGGTHAFALDTVVHPAYQRQGIGTALVRALAIECHKAGCTWLHVDFEPGLRAFYVTSCGFEPTDAALLRLEGSAAPPVTP